MRSNFPFLPYSSNQYATIYCSTPFATIRKQATGRTTSSGREIQCNTQKRLKDTTFVSICLQMTSKHHSNFIIKLFYHRHQGLRISSLVPSSKSIHEPQEKLQTPAECRASSDLYCAQSVAHTTHQTSTGSDHHYTQQPVQHAGAN